jgi:hypothetical protein
MALSITAMRVPTPMLVRALRRNAQVLGRRGAGTWERRREDDATMDKRVRAEDPPRGVPSLAGLQRMLIEYDT